MMVNPFPFGVFLGVIGTLFVEMAIIIGLAVSHTRRKK